MKVELNKIELGYLNELIELEQDNNLNDDTNNGNNIMVRDLVKKLTIPVVVSTCCDHEWEKLDGFREHCYKCHQIQSKYDN